MRKRIWGIPVLRVSLLPGPDDPPEPRVDQPRNIHAPAVPTPEPTVGPSGPAAMSPAPAAPVERLDVPPERRPWDRTDPPPTLPTAPHCNGRHGVEENEAGYRCEWCDALTGLITLVKELELHGVLQNRRIAALEERLARRDAS